MTLAVQPDGSIDLAQHAPLIGRIAIEPILQAERSDTAVVQLLMHAGKLYLVADGFRNVWELTPQPETGRAAYRPIGSSNEPHAGVRLSRYGDPDGAGVRIVAADGDDPQELYEAAAEQLDRGRTDQAATSLSALETLLSEDPHWDPGGSYRATLVPELAERRARVERSLEKLADAAGVEEVHDIVGELPTGAERDAVLRSEAFAAAVEASVRRLRAEIERQRVRATQHDNDERVEMLKRRLEAIKRELVEGVAARERIEVELEAERARLRNYEQTLIGSIATREVDSAGSPESDLATFLDRVTRKHLALMRTTESQNCSQKAHRLRAVGDYTLANKINVAAGGRDLGKRIHALRKAVESLPLESEAECSPDRYPR